MNFDLVKFLTMPLRIFMVFGIFSGLIMFLPEIIIRMLYLDNVKKSYGQIIGLIFIFSVSMLIVFIAGKLLKLLKRKYGLFMLKREQYMFLKRLDRRNIEFIKMFIAAPAHTIPVPYQNGTVIEMTHHGVISPAGNTHLVNLSNPEIRYFLQPWVISRIQEYHCLQEMYQVNN